MDNLKSLIETAWENRALLEENTTKEAVRTIVDLLDKGDLRVAEPTTDGWQVNEWVKKAVVMYFPIQTMETIEVGPFEFHDKIPLKTGYAEKGIRVVPHAVARHGAYISKGTILMPSYVNIGAYVDEGTMVDTWATSYFNHFTYFLFLFQVIQSDLYIHDSCGHWSDVDLWNFRVVTI